MSWFERFLDAENASNELEALAECLPDEECEAKMYCLVERINETEWRLIGHISVRAFDDCCEYVAEDEVYLLDDPDYKFKSSTDNLVCEPSDLWLSYRDD